jgi:hypothetical protein
MNHVLNFYAESHKHYLRLKSKKLLAVMNFNSRHSIYFIHTSITQRMGYRPRMIKSC